MVNSANFSKRLDKIIEYYELNASSFADAIVVGRSSISHIISGRNKPSLDFVMKVVSTFSEVDLYWLLNGKGNFPKSKAVSQTTKDTQQASTSQENQVIEAPEDLFSTTARTNVHIDEQEQPVLNPLASSTKAISKVIVLYTDGSFESFEN